MSDETSEQGTVRYIRCPSCGTPNPATALTCTRCSKPMQVKEAAGLARPVSLPPAEQVICAKCGKPLPSGSRFCGFCGAPLAAPAPAAPPPAVRKPAERQAAPTQPVAPPVAPKVAPLVSKPAAPAAPPLPPLRPVVSKPPTPVPIPKAPPAPAAPPTPAEGEDTYVFAGLHTPRIEASVVELKQDGSTGKTVRIIQETTFGRGTCDISYPADTLLSPRHASLQVRAGKLILKDLGSQNGTFQKQRQDGELTPGDVFLLGRELFRFVTQSMDENQDSTQDTQLLMGAPKLQRGPVTAKLEHIQLSGEVIEEFSLEKPETTLGRTKGDLVFNDDPYMSGMHARIAAQPGRFILQDLKSRNGVYRRIRNEVELRHGDEFFLGEQLFRVEIKTS